MSPADIRDKDLFPKGFYPLPHPNHPEGGMVFPQFEINEIQKQEARDLARFDLDFDIPDHFLPEFPAPIYLTTRPDLGDVSQGRVVMAPNMPELKVECQFHEVRLDEAVQNLQLKAAAGIDVGSLLRFLMATGKWITAGTPTIKRNSPRPAPTWCAWTIWSPAATFVAASASS